MGSIEVFYQREGTREIEHIEATPETTFGAVMGLLAEKHGLGPEVVLFLEDTDEPVVVTQTLHGHAGRAGVKLHAHRCRHVDVAVTFNGQQAEHGFGPGTTIARVKKWAAQKFAMTPEDASEHVLQIAGTHDRPPPGTHLGALVMCPHCRVAFDLVPDHRVNGAT
jgi:hypothetical protein